MTQRGDVERTLSWRRVAFSGARALTALLVLIGFVSAAHGQQARSLFGVVSHVDEVGKAIQVVTPRSSMSPHRETFLVAETTEILVHEQPASLADLRKGEEVRVTYFPMSLPHARRIEVP